MRCFKKRIKRRTYIDDIEIKKVISIIENFFTWDNNRVHQYIFTHLVKFNDSKYNSLTNEFAGAEVGKNVVYKWINIKDIRNEHIKPNYVVEQILSLSDSTTFNTCVE